MAVQNATDVTLSVGGKVISHATSCSLSISRELRDASSKQSGGFTKNLDGIISWEVSGDGFIDLDDGGVNTIFSSAFTTMTNVATDPVVAVVFTIGSSGDTYTGNAYITSLSADAGFEDNATYSITLNGTDGLTQVVA